MRVSVLLALLLACITARAQHTDSTATLEAITISAQRTPTTLRTAAPTQVATVERLTDEGAMLLSDAVKMMSGVTLKDYGGVGGMKTVSARGLGSQFSTLTIDGVPVDDAQNGQVDLGRYMIGNSAFISFSQGQQQSPLLTAKAYAAGNVLNMETAVPSFFAAERTNLKVGMDVGSFGLLSPQALWEHRWNRSTKSSLWVNYLKSDGDYPFTLYYTPSRTDSSSRERRSHSAMHMLTADANLFFDLGRGHSLHGKAHYSGGAHDLPGAVIYYTQVPSAQQTAERAAFGQLRWRTERKRWQTQAIAKYQYNYDLYEDTANANPAWWEHSEYRQWQAYGSGTVAWQPLKGLELNAALDADRTKMLSSLTEHNDVQRRKLVAVVAAAYKNRHIELRANAVATAVDDTVAATKQRAASGLAYRKVSPYAAVQWNITQHASLRYFYKETYRVPTFGELYFYTQLFFKLDPELARQHNLGLTLMQQWDDLELSGSVDAYRNQVVDKIIAYPTGNMFRWSMINMGKVSITGLDATAEARWKSLSLRANYSFQHAVDRTDSTSRTYGHQIPYTPRHSGSLGLRWENRWVNLGATAMLVGERYSQKQNTDNNRLPAYHDLSLGADHTFDTRFGTLRVALQVMNLTDQQYEVVRNYPMMGRNYRLSLTYEF